MRRYALYRVPILVSVLLLDPAPVVRATVDLFLFDGFSAGMTFADCIHNSDSVPVADSLPFLNELERTCRLFPRLLHSFGRCVVQKEST